MKDCGFLGNTLQLRAEGSKNCPYTYFKWQNYVILRMPSHSQPHLYSHHFQNFNLESDANQQQQYRYKGRILGTSHTEGDLGDVTN